MESNLAVLIDFENIAAGTEKEGLGRFDVDALMKRVKDKGRILVSRSYADWGRFARFKQSLLMANVTMYELTSHGMQNKNRADIAMVVDALELAFTKDYIDTFVIVSGDSDFTPLVLKMRELGKSVIGCGTRSSTSRLLIEACDEFFFYDSIAKDSRRRQRAPRPPNKKGYDLDEAFDLLLDAVEGLQRENPDPPLASVVKSALLRKSPDFAESDLKFSSFGRFLEAAAEQGKVRLSRDEKSGGYRVDGDVNGRGGGGAKKSATKATAKASSDEDSLWFDPYAPEGAEDLIRALAEENFNPLAAPTRKALLELVEQSVADRKKRRRRTNANFVQEDVRKKLAKSHPDVPAKAVRNVFNALMRAGVFIHRDGTPVRTGLAPFDLFKSAEEINAALANVYLDLLFENGVDLSDSDLLAELFLGDAERQREIEEIVAWLQASDVDEGSADDEDDLEEVDIDEFLEVEPTGEEPVEEKPKKAASKKGGKASKNKAEAKEPEAMEADDAEAKEADDAEAKPKKKTRSRKKKTAGEKQAEATAERVADKAEESEEVVEAEAEEPEAEAKPKKKTTRRRKKKPATPKPEADSNDADLDAMLETGE